MAAGLDYIIVDMEHGSHSDADAATLCAAGRTLGFCVSRNSHDLPAWHCLNSSSRRCG